MQLRLSPRPPSPPVYYGRWIGTVYTPPPYSDTEPVEITGRLGADIYSPAGAFVGWVPIVLSATYAERVNKVGDFEMRVPAVHPSASYLTNGRQVSIVREGEGEVCYGLIERIVTLAEERGPVLLVSGPSLAGELVRAQTYIGVVVNDETVADAADLILAAPDAPSWTATVTGTYANNVTRRWDNKTLYQALVELADTTGAYVRETSTAREIEIKNTTADSGIILRNFEHLSPEARENTNLGLVRGVRVRSEGEAVINRVVPIGLKDEDAVLGLAPSDRSSPYTIQEMIVADVHVTGEDGDSGGTSIAGTVRCWGPNRLLLFVCAFASAAGEVTTLTWQGQAMERVIRDTSGSYYMEIWMLLNPKKHDGNAVGAGTNQYPLRGTITGGAGFEGRTYALQDVDQDDPVRDTSFATGTSTAPSVTVDSELQDLVVAFSRFAGGTGTPGAGFLTEGEMDENDPGVLVRRGTKAGAATSTTAAWTLSGSVGWKTGGVSIKPARTSYIEDATSVSAYGRRATMLINRGFGLAGIELLNAANSLYDWASTYLQRAKDPVTYYDVDVAYLGDTDWLVGDSVNLIYTGIADLLASDGTLDREVWLDVDEDLIVLERTTDLASDGTRAHKLLLSPAYRWPRTLHEMLAGQLASKISDMEAQ